MQIAQGEHKRAMQQVSGPQYFWLDVVTVGCLGMIILRVSEAKSKGFLRLLLGGRFLLSWLHLLLSLHLLWLLEVRRVRQLLLVLWRVRHLLLLKVLLLEVMSLKVLLLKVLRIRHHLLLWLLVRHHLLLWLLCLMRVRHGRLLLRDLRLRVGTHNCRLSLGRWPFHLLLRRIGHRGLRL